MSSEDHTQELIETFEDLLDTDGLSRHVRSNIEDMVKTLKEDIDLSLRIHKVHTILQELDENPQLPMDIRTQFLQISAALEMITTSHASV